MNFHGSSVGWLVGGFKGGSFGRYNRFCWWCFSVEVRWLLLRGQWLWLRLTWIWTNVGYWRSPQRKLTEFCLTFTTSCTFSTQSIVPKSPSPLWRMIDHIPFEYRLSTSSPSSRSGPIKTTSNNAFQQPASLRPSVCRSVIFLHTHSLTLSWLIFLFFMSTLERKIDYWPLSPIPSPVSAKLCRYTVFEVAFFARFLPEIKAVGIPDTSRAWDFRV